MNENKEYIRKEEIALWVASGLSDEEIVEKLRNMYNASMNVLWGLLAREIGTVYMADLKDLSDATLSFIKDGVAGSKLRVEFDEEIERKSFQDKIEELRKKRDVKE